MALRSCVSSRQKRRVNYFFSVYVFVCLFVCLFVCSFGPLLILSALASFFFQTDCDFCNDFMLGDCICEDLMFCIEQSCYVPEKCNIDKCKILPP